MSIPGAGNPLLLGGAGGYKIERSLRFNSADSAYLSRTPASAGNRKTWTWSGWVKRSALGTDSWLLNCGNTGSDTALINFGFVSDNLLLGTGTRNVLVSTQVFRDPSAWYHVVLSVDTTNATADNRQRLYINGTEITAFSTRSNFTLNQDTGINQAFVHYIGRREVAVYFSGYLAEVHFIDGQALTPSSFGETDINGVWQPKAYTGSYGTNGFQLKFADNSNNTATTLGKDTSGNGNNWTPNNLSVTAGAGNDSLVDTPTNYGVDTGAGAEVRGNYATLNPLDKTNQFGSGLGPLANGNLELVGATATQYTATSTMQLDFNCYSEFVGGTQYVGFRGVSNSNLYSWFPSTSQYYNNGSYENVGVTYSSTDVVGVAFNSSTLTATFYKNGASQFSKTLPSGSYVFLVSTVGTGNCVCNFGQRQWAYAPPAGFKALCTQNLPAPTITKPSTVMDVALWTGNGSARSITGLGFNPDLVWIKGRSGATDHALYDSVRGATIDLVSNSTAAETTQTQGLTAFNSDGFSLGTLAKVNTNTATYAGWTWDAGSSTVTNPDGTISSQVRANASAGFSVVTWTGNGASATVGHGLGVAPSFLIVKNRGTTNSWIIYHRALGGAYYLQFDTLTAGGSANATWGSANSDPTASVFSVGSGAATNGNGSIFVAYCFAPVAGYSAFGSYTGNGSADGPFVYTGFRPSYLLIKQSSASGQGWEVRDYAREPYNDANRTILRPNSADAEVTDAFPIDFLSNGFKLRSIGTGSNENAQTYIYAAFAEHPFALARAR